MRTFVEEVAALVFVLFLAGLIVALIGLAASQGAG